MSSTIEFAGVTLVFICTAVLSFVAGADPVLALNQRQFATVVLDMGIGALVGLFMMIYALVRDGLDIPEAVAVAFATMIAVICVVYIPVVLLVSYTPAFEALLR